MEQLSINYDQVFVWPGVVESYMRNPTVANAEIMFTAAGLELPFARLAASLSEKRQRRRRSSRSPDPSGKRPRTNLAKGGGMIGSSTWVALDTWHDILPDPASATAQFLLSHVHGLPAAKRKLLENLAPNDATRVIAEKICDQPPLDRNVPFIIEKETELYQMVSRWKYMQDDLQIVLDGALDGLREDSESQQHRRAVLLFGFFQLLLARENTIRAFGRDVVSMKKVYPERQRLKTITLLTGMFQTLDIPRFPDFVNRWMQAVSGVEHVRGQIRIAELGSSAPASADTSFRLTSVAPGNTRLSLDDVDVPLYMIGTPQRTISTASRQNPATALRYLESRFGLPYTKAQFRQVFALYEALPEAKRKSWEPFLWRICRLNAFRDSYRAEVAIAAGAVFLTFDRLAMIVHGRIGSGAGEAILFRPSMGGTDLLVRSPAAAT